MGSEKSEESEEFFFNKNGDLLEDVCVDNSYKTKMRVVQLLLNCSLMFINISVLYSLLVIPGESVGGLVYSALFFVIFSFVNQLLIGVFLGVLTFRDRSCEKNQQSKILNNAVIALAVVLMISAILVMSLYIDAATISTTDTISTISGEGDDFKNISLCE